MKKYLQLKKKNNCCLTTTGEIVIIDFIGTNLQRKKIIVGKKFKTINNLFEIPCQSSLLNVYKVENISVKCYTWPVDNITFKMIVIPLSKAKNQFAAYPLLHSVFPTITNKIVTINMCYNKPKFI